MDKKNEKTRKEIFGLRLGEIMRNRRLDVVDLIRLIDESGLCPDAISANTVRGWYNGEHIPRGELVAVLAIVLDTTTDYLYGLDDRDLFGDIISAVNSVLKLHNRVINIENLANKERCVQRMHCINESRLFDMYSGAQFGYSRMISIYTTESVYMIVDGNVYPEDCYHRFEHEILSNPKSIYSTVNMAVKQGNIKAITAIKAAYKNSRAALGVIGATLSADEFMQLCYILGYFTKHR